MKQSPSISQLGTLLARFAKKHHIVLFSLTVVIGVTIAVFLLNSLIILSSKDEPVTASSPKFDQETIDKISKLSEPGEEADDFFLPPGRTNPFVD